MDVYTSSSGLQQVVGYGPHSVVLAHNGHHHHHNNNYHHHSHSLPPRLIPKATSSYQLVSLVPIAPTTVYVPVEQQRQQPNYEQSQGNHP